MNSIILSILLVTLFLCGCGSEEGVFPVETEENSVGEDVTREESVVDKRFVSKDRGLDKIFADFEKPVESFPTISQDESVIQKNGRLYRKDILDTPFTGTLIENFPDGTRSLTTSYYRGLPHGHQLRNFPNGQRALEASFDQGVLVGVKSRWWPNSILREEAYWSEGRYIGRRLWDRTGRLIKEEVIPQS